MDLRPGRIELHIDELGLHGLPAGQRHTIGDAMIRELERLLADRVQQVVADGTHDRLDAGRITASAHGEATGRAIALAVLNAALPGAENGRPRP